MKATETTQTRAITSKHPYVHVLMKRAAKVVRLEIHRDRAEAFEAAGVAE